MEKQPNMEDILEYGLISEFSYLTLESKYFQQENNKNGIVSYSNENIKEYLQATEEQIETILENERIIIPKEQQSFIEKLETKLPFYNEDFFESVDKYRDIKADRVDEMLKINERYEILEFMSDSKTDLQIILLQNKQTGKYVITSRGTASADDVKVDTDMSANFNPQYQPAINFTMNAMNKYEIDVENLIFTGHSLGGTTSNMLGLTVGAKAYSYNPFGAYNIYTKNPFKDADSLYSGANANVDLEKAKEHLFIVSYQDNGNVNGDLLSNAATDLNGNRHVGTVIKIQGDNVDIGTGHSIVTLNKTINNKYINTENDNKEVIFPDNLNEDNLKLFNSLQKVGIDTIKAGQNSYTIKKSEVTVTDENGNILSSIPLEKDQTISHIAQKTPYNSIELLEYNDLTLEEAKSLPVGFKVRIPKDIQRMQSTEGEIKFFENHEGGGLAIVPSSEGKVFLEYEKGDFFESSPNRVSFGNETWTKGSDGVLFKSEVNTEDFKIDYIQNEDGNSVVSNIEIKKQTSYEELAKHTKFSKEELKAFNHLESDSLEKDSKLQIPVSKKEIEGGYGDITQYTTQDGEYIFIVPNSDNTKTIFATFTDGFNENGAYEINSNGSININFEDRVIILNKDGYYFDSYGLEDKVDIEYKRLENDELIVESLKAKQDIDLIKKGIPL